MVYRIRVLRTIRSHGTPSIFPNIPRIRCCTHVRSLSGLKFKVDRSSIGRASVTVLPRLRPRLKPRKQSVGWQAINEVYIDSQAGVNIDWIYNPSHGINTRALRVTRRVSCRMIACGRVIDRPNQTSDESRRLLLLDQTRISSRGKWSLRISNRVTRGESVNCAIKFERWSGIRRWWWWGVCDENINRPVLTRVGLAHHFRLFCRRNRCFPSSRVNTRDVYKRVYLPDLSVCTSRSLRETRFPSCGKILERLWSPSFD